MAISSTNTNTPTARPDLQVDDLGRLDADVLCLRCQYNLRGSDPDGRCPECGLAVGRSTRGHWLRYCDPTWLRYVWCGYNYLGLIVVGVGATYGLGYIGFIDVVERYLNEPAAIALFLLIVCSLLVFGLFGLWRIGTPDPDRVMQEPFLSKRRLARFSFLFLPAGVAAASIYAAFEHLWLSQFRGDDGAVTVGLLTCLLMPVATLWYAQSLAARIPAPWLRRMTWLTLALLLGTGLLFHLVAANYMEWINILDEKLVYLWYGQQPGHTVYGYGITFAPMFGWTAVYSVATSLALMLALFTWYWRAMKKQADLAKQTWAALPGPREAETQSSGSRHRMSNT